MHEVDDGGANEDQQGQEQEQEQEQEEDNASSETSEDSESSHHKHPRPIFALGLAVSPGFAPNRVGITGQRGNLPTTPAPPGLQPAIGQSIGPLSAQQTTVALLETDSQRRKRVSVFGKLDELSEQEQSEEETPSPLYVLPPTNHPSLVLDPFANTRADSPVLGYSTFNDPPAPTKPVYAREQEQQAQQPTSFVEVALAVGEGEAEATGPLESDPGAMPNPWAEASPAERSDMTSAKLPLAPQGTLIPSATNADSPSADVWLELASRTTFSPASCSNCVFYDDAVPRLVELEAAAGLGEGEGAGEGEGSAKPKGVPQYFALRRKHEGNDVYVLPYVRKPQQQQNPFDPFNHTPGIEFPGVPGSPMGEKPFYAQVGVPIFPSDGEGGEGGQ